MQWPALEALVCAGAAGSSRTVVDAPRACSRESVSWCRAGAGESRMAASGRVAGFLQETREGGWRAGDEAVQSGMTVPPASITNAVPRAERTRNSVADPRGTRAARASDAHMNRLCAAANGPARSRLCNGSTGSAKIAGECERDRRRHGVPVAVEKCRGRRSRWPAGVAGDEIVRTSWAGLEMASMSPSASPRRMSLARSADR